MAPPLVSIVTPVYNGEKYIEACIQSVREQTYQNWEYIIINNCSTDKTPEIAVKCAAEDDRIRLINNDHLLPIMRNHNFALQQISPESKYCKMVHADDLLWPECVELMVAAAEVHSTAGIVGSYSLWGKKVVSDGLPFGTSFLLGKELGRLTLLDKLYCFWSPSALMIRSDLIRRRPNFYPDDHLHADVDACYEVLQVADFAFVQQVLTFIRRHDHSATATVTDAYNKTLLSNLELFLKYGPFFLTQHEFKVHLAVRNRKYYRFLARSLFGLNKKRDFWDYHQEGLKRVGQPLSKTKLLSAVISELIRNPVTTISQLYKAVRGVQN